MTEPNPSTGSGGCIAALQVARQPAATGARTADSANESDPAANFDRVMARVSARQDASAKPRQDAESAKKAAGDDKPQDADAAPADGSAPPNAGVAADLATAALPTAVAPVAMPPAAEAQPTDTPAQALASERTSRIRTPAAAELPASAQAKDALPADAVPAAEEAKVPPPRAAARARPSNELPAHDARTDKPTAAAAAPLPSAARETAAESIERRFERALGAATAARAEAPVAPPGAAANMAIAPAATYSIAHAKIATPVLHPGFGEDLANRVVFLAGQRVQSAEIALTPADLGPLSVTIEIRGHEASLFFGSAHATTRAALEDALPRLREMFAGSGLQLADAQVGDDGRRDFPRPQRGAGDPMRAIGSVNVAPDLLRPARPAHPDRLIDVVV
jgi:flagellar hook-length control protein FliK